MKTIGRQVISSFLCLSFICTRGFTLIIPHGRVGNRWNLHVSFQLMIENPYYFVVFIHTSLDLLNKFLLPSFFALHIYMFVNGLLWCMCWNFFFYYYIILSTLSWLFINALLRIRIWTKYDSRCQTNHYCLNRAEFGKQAAIVYVDRWMPIWGDGFTGDRAWIIKCLSVLVIIQRHARK